MIYNALTGYNTSLTKPFPTWLDSLYGYGNAYQGPTAEKTFAEPGVDPYSLLPPNPNPTAQAPQMGQGGNPGLVGFTPPSPQNNGAQDYSGPGGQANPMGNTGDGSFSNFGSDLSGLVGGIGSAIGDMFGGGGYGFGDGAGGNNSGAMEGGPGNGGAQGATANGSDMAGMGMYRGGIVTPNRLSGPNPPGPDDGYAALDHGEGVLTAKAVKHYGKGLVARLNKLQVPKKAMR